MQKGEFAHIEYIGRLETGEIFDLTDEKLAKKEKIFNPNAIYKPIPVIIGEGFVLPGLDHELESMNVGDSKKTKISPEKAFGPRRPDMIRMIPLKEFRKEGLDPQPGLVVDLGGIKGRIQSVSSGRVRVDFNNPLAGKVLEYDVKITDRIEKSDDKINGILEFFTGSKHEVKITGDTAEVTLKEIQLPPQLEKKISELVLKYLPIKNVKFSTMFSKKENTKETEPTTTKK